MRKAVKRKPRKSAYLKRLLLNALSNVGEAAYSVLDEGFLNPAYAFTGPSRALLGMDRELALKRNKKREVHLRKNLIAVTLYRLRKEGLVAKKGKRKLTLWKITQNGQDYLDQARISNSPLQLPPKDGNIRIVSFDIPEKERWKRDRLRQLLTASDYSMLQRSLWTGRRPLPHFVFTEIKFLKLRHFIHIFEISKRGTIKGLV